VAQLPEISFLRVHDDLGRDPDALYSLVHNRAHANVEFMFDETARLEPADDTLTAGRGPLGSYPNFIFTVNASQIDALAQARATVRDGTDFPAVVETWGLRRSSPELWPTVDWLHAEFRRCQPTQYGLFDLDRYGNY